MKKHGIMDGNEACATIAYYFSEVVGIYPITPASPMATLCDKWSAEGRKNLFGNRVKVVEMQSEAGASALVHGSLQAGSLTTSFTASQGLLLMIPSMYKIAGELLPGVIHVAARSLSTHALSIFGDHQDVYAARTTGFAILASSSVQDAYNLALVTHLSSLKGSIPFIHFFDGFRTSHEINKISLLEDEDIKSLINKKYIDRFKDRAINIGKPTTRGTSQTEDVYFQITESRNKYYDALPDIVNEYMKKVNKLTGKKYKPFEYHGVNNASFIIIAMGSVCETVKKVVDDLNKDGGSFGLIEVHLYRPFSKEYLKEVLPTSVRNIAVLDRTKESGSEGEPLFLDVCAALRDTNIKIIHGRYGLSSKNVTPRDIKAVFDNLKNYNMKQEFTIGINDDLTNLSLDTTDYKLKEDNKEIKIYGFGSDGMVSGSKNLLKVIGNATDDYVQGYFEYDSKKSGGVTISHLRISKQKIEAPYYVTSPNVVVVTREDYLKLYNVLDDISENGIFILASELSDQELNKMIPNYIKEIIKNKNIRFFITSPEKLLKKYSLGNKVNSIIVTYLLKMLGCKEDVINEFNQIIKNTYKSKGEKQINNNIDAIKDAFSYIREFDKEEFTFKEEKEEKKCSNCTECMFKRNGSCLSVSELEKYSDGVHEAGMSKSEKRKISSKVPKWKKENCIECGLCSFVCPHGVIRSFSINDSELEEYGLTKEDVIPSIGETNKNFYISVTEQNCTGCGQCIGVCPGKNKEAALAFGVFSELLNKRAKKLFENHINDVPFPISSIKGLSFKKPGFEFPGACAGCGETPYIKLLTTLYRDQIVIANATGCSSIYGASLPSTPYSIPWISSLFEDNAEFGLGIYTSYKNTRERIKKIMFETKDQVEQNVKDIYKRWIDNIEDDKITKEVLEDLKGKTIPSDLKDLLEYIPSRKVWCIGGDGWAYDIGYGGLDHVLHSGEDIKVLILDTEVYSNTGGQSSKSTKASAVAEFASLGKNTQKKDLFRILMSIPNIYIASVSLGADYTGTIRAFKEAYEHKGPSVIIAYSPCIEHGIIGGLTSSLEEQKLLVESGYNLLMRYNGNTEELIIDSKDPKFEKIETIFGRELRYKNLTIYNDKNSEKLYNKNIDNAKKRYQYFKNLEIKKEAD